MARIEVTKENSLASLYPEIAAQWHPEKNGDLTPETVRVEGRLLIWWKCEKGHEWRAMTSARVAGLGCPICLEMGTFIRGKNDLQTLCPKIAAQWHPEKNGDLQPSNVAAESNKKVWWRCEKGHEWKTSIQGRVVENARCPFCSGRRVMAGVNDIATTYPDVAAEWDYDVNVKRPEECKPTSKEKVSWICSYGHRWTAAIEKRTTRGQGCPYCSGRRAIPGETDIATTNPEVMIFWDYEKNDSEGIHPEDIKPYSDKKIWYRCEKGHSRKVQAKKVVMRERTCPYCSNKKILPGENDFATLAPAGLLEEWDREKNTVQPDSIALHYGKKVWWRCDKGHEWRATPDGRLRGEPYTGCPYCIGLYVAKGENDLMSRAPEILDEFSPRNRKRPDEIHYCTVKKAWWKCRECGYEWRTSVYARTRLGEGCPRCKGRKA